MNPADQFIVHPNPVWREKSNFIIDGELREADRPQRFEQLIARQIDGNCFEICCIPFFIYDLALGDIVGTEPKDGRKYVVSRLIKSSGRYVFRVWFGDSFCPPDSVASDLRAMGTLLEWSSRNLLSVDAADKHHAQLVADYLAERERAGQLIYETGRS